MDKNEESQGVSRGVGKQVSINTKRRKCNQFPNAMTMEVNGFYFDRNSVGWVKRCFPVFRSPVDYILLD